MTTRPKGINYAGGFLGCLGVLVLGLTFTSASAAAHFAGGYTALGVLTIAAALILFTGKESHSAIFMVGLYVCTMVTGVRIWELWFAINTSPSCFYPGLYWLNWGSVTHVRSTALIIAWPFIALAGHCFISASGCLVRQWSTLRNRIAVMLCGVTLCVGLLFPWRMFCIWHEWFTEDLTRMAETCNETRGLTDDITDQLTKEYANDWQVLLVRANYLSAVGRSKEAGELTATALRLLPPEQETMRKAITEDMKRTPKLTGP